MPSPRDPGHARRRAAQRRAARRLRRFAGLIVLASVTVLTLLLTAFSGSPSTVGSSAAVPQPRPVAPGPPEPQVIALHGSLRIQLPVAQQQVTAIGYHAVADGALQLDPLGRQGNRGLLGRLADRIVGESADDLVWYDLGGGPGPARSSLNVGAAPGTDVFAPVDGTVVGITPMVLNGRHFGARVDIQPATAPSVVVSVTRVKQDPALTVGSSVVAGVFKIGSVIDLSKVERQALARFTQDAGNHVAIEVRPAATLALG
jgi:hypothetical protein